MRTGQLRIPALLAAASLLAACGGAATSATPAAGALGGKAPIVIGDLVTLTTANALTGKEEETGRQMAVHDINAAGGVDGHPLQLATEDTAFNNQTAINAFQKVLGQHPVAILAPVWSNQALALEPLIKKAQVPTLFAGSAGSVTQQGNPYMFRDLTDESYATPVVAQWFLQQVHATKPAIIYSNDAFGVSLKDAVLSALKKNGTPPVSVQTFDDSATDVSSQLSAIRSAGADALFCECVSATGALVVRSAYQEGYKPAMLVGNPILAGSVLKLVPAQALTGVYVESNYAVAQSTNPQVQAWVKRFEQEYKTTPDWAQAVNYGAVYLLAHVMKQYGTTPQQIDAGLHKVKYKGLFTTYSSDAEGNLWHGDDIVRFGANKHISLVKELTIPQ